MNKTLDHELAAAAAGLALPEGDLDAVLHRAKTRTSHRRRLTATAMAVAVLAGTAAGVTLTRGDGGGTASLLPAGAPGVQWRRVAPTSGLGPASGLSSGGTNPLYALSTAPGQVGFTPGEAPNRVVWRSEDGVEWAAASTLGKDLFLSDLAVRDKRVYAVGTAAATASVGERPASELLVGWSDDGARTFQRSRLPVDMSALAAKTRRSGVRMTEVAAGPSGVLAVAVLTAELNVPALLPGGVTAPNGWATTKNGVDLLGAGRPAGCPNPRSSPPTVPSSPTTAAPSPTGEVPDTHCGEPKVPGGVVVIVPAQEGRGVAASYTWAELGVEGDLLRAVLGQPVAFFAPSGTTRFTRVEMPGFDGQVNPLLLNANGDGFNLVLGVSGGPGASPSPAATVVLHSDQGRRLTPVGNLPRLTSVSAAGVVQDRLTIVGATDQRAVVVRSDGAGGWTSTELATVLNEPGRSGVVQVMEAAIGPLGVVVAVVPVPAREGDLPQGRLSPPLRLLVSRDGETWSDQPMDELAGEQVDGVGYIVVTEQRAVVAARLRQTGGPGVGPTPQVLLVGMPA